MQYYTIYMYLFRNSNGKMMTTDDCKNGFGLILASTISLENVCHILFSGNIIEIRSEQYLLMTNLAYIHSNKLHIHFKRQSMFGLIFQNLVEFI